MPYVEAIQRVVEGREEVRLLYLFGSAARGEARPSSDIDLAVFFDRVPEPRDLDALISDLQTAARRRIDLVVLNEAPPLLTHEVIASGRLLVCRDEDERVRFETRAITRFLDTAHLRRVQHGYLRARSEAYRARSS